MLLPIQDLLCLKGQEQAIKQIESCLQKHQHSSSFLLHGGPFGIGKASLACYLANSLITGTAMLSEASAAKKDIWHHMQQGSCHEFLWLDGIVRDDDGLFKRLQPPVITIDTIRKLQDFAHHSSINQRSRVCILDNADYMTHQATNSLLKLLEEPPYGLHLILISQNRAHLLSTISSRCQKIMLAALSAELIKDYSQQKNWHTSPLIEASGSLGFAQIMQSPQWQQIADLLQMMYRDHKSADILAQLHAAVSFLETSHHVYEGFMLGLLFEQQLQSVTLQLQTDYDVHAHIWARLHNLQQCGQALLWRMQSGKLDIHTGLLSLWQQFRDFQKG